MSDFFHTHPRARQALDLLDRPAWQPVLAHLIDRFAGTPDDLQQGVMAQVEDALIDVASLVGRLPDAPVARLMARRLAALDCFYLRATKLDAHGAAVYWNPLTEPYQDFAGEAAGEAVRCYATTDSYPAPDMVRKWAQEHLR